MTTPSASRKTFEMRAVRLMPTRQTLLRILTMTEQQEPARGECRHDTVVLGIFAGSGMLVLCASAALIAVRYYGA